MKAFCAILVVCAVSAQARRIINTNNADNGGVINNSNVIHREARYITNTNTASGGGIVNNNNIIGGGAPSGYSMSSSSYQQKPSRNGHGSNNIDNTNQASSNGAVNNGNSIHQHEAKSIKNANTASNGGSINNKNIIGGAPSGYSMSSYQKSPSSYGQGNIDNTNQASFNGMVNNGNSLHRQTRAISNTNVASNGGVVNNKNIIGGGGCCGNSAPSGYSMSGSSHQQMPQQYGHGYGSIDNTNQANFNGRVNNRNRLHRRSIHNENIMAGSGKITNSNKDDKDSIENIDIFVSTSAAPTTTTTTTTQKAPVRQARYMAALNQALETVAGGARSGGSPPAQHYMHTYGGSSHISNENHIMPGSGGSIDNVNAIHREARDVSLVNENVAAGSGASVDHANVVASREGRSYDPQDSTHPHAIMLHAMHLAAHTKGHY